MNKKDSNKKIYKLCLAVFCSLVMLSMLFPSAVKADAVSDENKYYLGAAVNTGRDNGYSESTEIKENDPHFGWNLGTFYVSGYTRAVESDKNQPIFLKNVGDTVSLWFSLEQDISCLNGDETLTIYEDSNGYDQYFGVEKTNFGRGTLVVRHIDYQNHASDPAIYTDYLAANTSVGADTKVDIFEEGDYEIALNYEIKSDSRKIFGVSIVPTYTNYRIFFRFSVRNGNCMVFPFDTVTGEELVNTSVTENGFYLDLAKSRYLDIDIKKEILTESESGLTEDVRFNRPAKDGDVYSEEGIYTITVSNRYTGQETTKKIYVGKNAILKAHVTTGYSIEEIQECVAKGGTIEADGTIKEAEGIWALLGEKIKTVIRVVFNLCKVIGVVLILWIIFRMIFPRSRRGRY